MNNCFDNKENVFFSFEVSKSEFCMISYVQQQYGFLLILF